MSGIEPIITDHAIRRFIQYVERLEVPNDYRLSPEISKRYTERIRECLRRTRPLPAALRPRPPTTHIIQRGDYHFDPVTQLCFVFRDLDNLAPNVVTVIQPSQEALAKLLGQLADEDRLALSQPASEQPVPPNNLIIRTEPVKNDPVLTSPLEICVLKVDLETGGLDEATVANLMDWIARTQPTLERSVQLLHSQVFIPWLVEPLRRRFPHAYLMWPLPFNLKSYTNRKGMGAAPVRATTQMLFKPASSGFTHTRVLVTPQGLDPLLWIISQKIHLPIESLDGYRLSRTIIGVNYHQTLRKSPSFSFSKL